MKTVADWRNNLSIAKKFFELLQTMFPDFVFIMYISVKKIYNNKYEIFLYYLLVVPILLLSWMRAPSSLYNFLK